MQLVSFLAALFTAPSVLSFTVSLTTLAPSPQLVGKPVTLIASIDDANPNADIVYQFAVSYLGDFNVVQSFRDRSSMNWVSIDEGPYILQVTAVDRANKETQFDALLFARDAPQHVGGASVLPTTHPQVFLFSAPPCPAGAVAMRVVFGPSSQPNLIDVTNFKPCLPGNSINIYVAGMIGETVYTMQAQFVTQGGLVNGVRVEKATGPAPIVRDWDILLPPGPTSGLSQDVLVNDFFVRGINSNWMLATNLVGDPIWSYFNPDVVSSTCPRPVPGGTFLCLDTEMGVRYLREIDLAGNVVRETNSDMLSAQLIYMGEDEISRLHHDAIRLPNGHTLVLASVERILIDEQGPGPVHVYGEMVLDLDKNLNIVWVWNSFDKLDRTRVAILGETCTNDTTAGVIEPQGGCPLLRLADGPANDWLHINAIGYSPSDGNFVLSVRHLDAVLKVDFADGIGTGDVIWELGEHGDFSLVNPPSGEIWPWFSHQHDTRYEDGELVVYDNVNTRIDALGASENSRGQSFILDEKNMLATLVVNVDLGHFSRAVGAAQKLSDGAGYHFHSGFLGTFPDSESVAMSVTPSGEFSWVHAGKGRAYRSIRMRSLYYLQ